MVYLLFELLNFIKIQVKLAKFFILPKILQKILEIEFYLRVH